MLRNEIPGLNVIEIPNGCSRRKGPAEGQAEVLCENDENITVSGVACPLEPHDTQLDLAVLLDKFLGKGMGKKALEEGCVATGDWNYVKDQPLKELKLLGFFTMAFPTIFINGTCDYTLPKLGNLGYDEFVEHIYYTGDNRVSKHPFLNFLLLNLGLRQRALQQGSFVVAQQLNDAHLSIVELKDNLSNHDESVPRKIISIAANLPNTHPFWRERKKELDSLLFFRLLEYGDMPVYFDTMSCAEYHCVPF